MYIPCSSPAHFIKPLSLKRTPCWTFPWHFHGFKGDIQDNEGMTPPWYWRVMSHERKATWLRRKDSGCLVVWLGTLIEKIILSIILCPLLSFFSGTSVFIGHWTEEVAFHEEVEGFYVQSLGTKSHGLKPALVLSCGMWILWFYFICGNIYGLGKHRKQQKEVTALISGRGLRLTNFGFPELWYHKIGCFPACSPLKIKIRSTQRSDMRLVQQTLPTRRVMKCLRIEDSVLWVARSKRTPQKTSGHRDGRQEWFWNLPRLVSSSGSPVVVNLFYRKPSQWKTSLHHVSFSSLFWDAVKLHPLHLMKIKATYSKKRAEIRQQKTLQLDLKPETYDLLSYSALSTFLGRWDW